MDATSRDALLSMFQDVITMLSLTRAGFCCHDGSGLEVAAALGRAIHKRENDLTEQLFADHPEREGLRFAPSHLERVADAGEGLIRCLRGMEAEGAVFTDNGAREVDQLFEKALELLECARDVSITGNAVLARHVEIESMRFHDTASDFARAHEARLLDGVCMPKASSGYLAMLDHLREITRHARRITARVVEVGAPPARRSV